MMAAVLINYVQLIVIDLPEKCMLMHLDEFNDNSVNSASLFTGIHDFVKFNFLMLFPLDPMILKEIIKRLV